MYKEIYDLKKKKKIVSYSEMFIYNALPNTK